MKHILLLCLAILACSESHAQFTAVSTDLAGWAAGNINVAVDVNVNLHNSVNIPVSFNPFKFSNTQWRHVVVQPGWRYWMIERYIGHFVSPSLFFANYELGHGQRYFRGNAYGVGFSWGYSILLNTRWNFLVEVGAGLIYTPYTERKYAKYIGEFDDEYTYRHHRLMLLPTKLNLSFSYLF